VVVGGRRGDMFAPAARNLEESRIALTQALARKA